MQLGQILQRLGWPGVNLRCTVGEDAARREDRMTRQARNCRAPRPFAGARWWPAESCFETSNRSVHIIHLPAGE